VAGATSNLAAAPEKRDASEGWKRRGKIGRRAALLEREKAAPVYNTRADVVVAVVLLVARKDAKLTKSFVLSAKTKDAEQSYGKRYPITTPSLSSSRILSDLSMYSLCIPIERLKFHANIVKAHGLYRSFVLCSSSYELSRGRGCIRDAHLHPHIFL